MRALTGIKNILLDLIFPAVCFGCRTEGAFICESCKKRLLWVHPTCFVCRKFVPAKGSVTAGRTCHACLRKSHIYAFLSPFLYSDPTVRELIHGLKYNRVRSVAPVLAVLMGEYFDRYDIFIPEDAVVVPVPLHKKRERVRGFNQAELIARMFQTKSGRDHARLSLEHGVLRRIKKTKPQVELAAEDRRKNVLGVFGVARPELIKEKTILLVDDVKTTGATLEEAARVLKEAGAKRVWAITVAH